MRAKENCHENSHFLTRINSHPLTFDQSNRVEKTLIQTLTFNSHQLSFDLDMRVEKTLIQTLACQLSSILM